MSATDSTQQSSNVTIPVTTEDLFVGKEQIETGRIRITKTVDERDVPVTVDLLQEETTVERVPINQPVDQSPGVRYEGDTMIVPVLREELVIMKQLILVEEVRISKRQSTTQSEQTVTLRSETVQIDHLATDDYPTTQSTE